MQRVMRVLVLALVGLIAVGCQKQDAPKPAEQAAQAPAAPEVVPVPTDNDPQAWKAYLTSMVKKHMDKRYKRPYMYFIPGGDDEEAVRQYEAQLENVQNAVGRGILAGSMLAFGGPDSAKIGDLIVESFKLAGPKSLKGVRVVFIGAAADQQRVAEAVAPSEAEFIFEEMK